MDEKDKKFLIAEHQNIRSEVEFSKRQQFAITNYTLILYGVIFGIYNQIGSSVGRAVVLCALSLIIGLISCCLLNSCEKSQKNNNDLQRKIREEFQVYKNITKDIQIRETHSEKIICVYYGIVALGFITISYLLFYKSI